MSPPLSNQQAVVTVAEPAFEEPHLGQLLSGDHRKADEGYVCLLLSISSKYDLFVTFDCAYVYFRYLFVCFERKVVGK